ncbi:hypothetical protein BC827DRAFT_1252209 [Russula dissimulans]|nr:hypothetical protein BC827DRAFT_1252209 [Russula dissimulans]
MSTVSAPSPSTSCPNFDAIFTSAFQAYKKKTGKDITSHPLAAELETCHSPEAILTKAAVKVLTNGYSNAQRSLFIFFRPRQRHWACEYRTVILLIFQAAKDVNASREALIELFNRIGIFFRRLEIYIEVPPTTTMTEILVQIMVEVLMIVGMATNEVKSGILSESIAG